jgi:hypothetical protein
MSLTSHQRNVCTHTSLRTRLALLDHENYTDTEGGLVLFHPVLLSNAG